MDLAEELEALIPPQEAGIVAPMPEGVSYSEFDVARRGLTRPSPDAGRAGAAERRR